MAKKQEEVFWKTEKRKLSELKHHLKNPRILSKHMEQKLLRSFKKHNYVELIVINLDNTILAGHQRFHTLQSLGYQGDDEIEVRVPSILLSDEDADDYLLTSNKVTGDFENKMLTEYFEDEFLKEIGWTDKELGLELEDDKGIESIDCETSLCIEVKCEDETQQRILFEELQGRGYECKILTL